MLKVALTVKKTIYNKEHAPVGKKDKDPSAGPLVSVNNIVFNLNEKF